MFEIEKHIESFGCRLINVKIVKEKQNGLESMQDAAKEEREAVVSRDDVNGTGIAMIPVETWCAALIGEYTE